MGMVGAQPARVRIEAAERLFAVLKEALGRSRWRLELWDGTALGEPTFRQFTLRFRSRRGLDRLIGDLPERAFGRAYVEGSIEVERLEQFLECVNDLSTARALKIVPRLAAAALSLGARPDPRGTTVEARLRGRLHSRTRDREAIRHHYDQPPHFYRLFLGETMTYSCAYFETPEVGLDAAQTAKLDLVCRKLRLRPGERLLDIGCGWGSLLFHAASQYGVKAVGITTSPGQARWARERAAELGLAGRVEVRLADYRDPFDEDFDAIASVGMFEHVGHGQMRAYTDAVHRLLRPGGRALIHGITTTKPGRWRSPFISTFVFPDGELQEVGGVISALQASGLEVRDDESLREHYARTLTAWMEGLDANWDRAVSLVGAERARVWKLYMTASAVSFRLGTISVHQVLAVRQGDQGRSGLPLTRADWYQPEAIRAAADPATTA